jgi:hypothetical protein
VCSSPYWGCGRPPFLSAAGSQRRLALRPATLWLPRNWNHQLGLRRANVGKVGTLEEVTTPLSPKAPRRRWRLRHVLVVVAVFGASVVTGLVLGVVPVGVRGETVEVPAYIETARGPCSGRPIIDTNVVVTSAGCVEDQPTEVRYGGQTLTVTGSGQHPRWDRTAATDVGWVQVGTTFTDDGFAARIASTISSFEVVSRPREYLGWAMRDAVDATSPLARRISVCRASADDLLTISLGYPDDVYRSACKFDPASRGAGLVVHDQGTPVLVGVVSGIAGSAGTDIAGSEAIVTAIP